MITRNSVLFVEHLPLRALVCAMAACIGLMMMQAYMCILFRLRAHHRLNAYLNQHLLHHLHVMAAFDSSCVSTSSPAETCARSSSVAGTGAFASPSEEIGACAFSHVAASVPTATSAFTSSPIAMDTSVYTCVPATTSTDAYVQRLPCEQHNYFSSYKTY